MNKWIIPAIALAFTSQFTTAEEIIIDNENPSFSITSGEWKESTSVSGYIGSDYLHDMNVDSPSEVRWELEIPDGRYEVFANWTADNNRTQNASYLIEWEHDVTRVEVDQTQNNGEWVSLGFFINPQAVRLSNAGAEGYVIADAIKVENILDQDPGPNPNTHSPNVGFVDVAYGIKYEGPAYEYGQGCELTTTQEDKDGYPYLVVHQSGVACGCNVSSEMVTISKFQVSPGNTETYFKCVLDLTGY